MNKLILFALGTVCAMQAYSQQTRKLKLPLALTKQEISQSADSCFHRLEVDSIFTSKNWRRYDLICLKIKNRLQGIQSGKFRYYNVLTNLINDSVELYNLIQTCKYEKFNLYYRKFKLTKFGVNNKTAQSLLDQLSYQIKNYYLIRQNLREDYYANAPDSITKESGRKIKEYVIEECQDEEDCPCYFQINSYTEDSDLIVQFVYAAGQVDFQGLPLDTTRCKRSNTDDNYATGAFLPCWTESGEAGRLINRIHSAIDNVMHETIFNRIEGRREYKFYIDRVNTKIHGSADNDTPRFVEKPTCLYTKVEIDTCILFIGHDSCIQVILRPSEIYTNESLAYLRAKNAEELLKKYPLFNKRGTFDLDIRIGKIEDKAQKYMDRYVLVEIRFVKAMNNAIKYRTKIKTLYPEVIE